MSALTDLIPLVRRKAPGIPDIMMLDALLDAYKEFCIKSEFLTTSHEITAPEAGAPQSLTPKDNYTINKVSSVIAMLSDGSNSELYVNADYSRPDPKTITFNDSLVSVTVNTVEAPSAIVDPLLLDVDASVFERYGDKIAFGAAAALRAMPAQPWTEFGLSENYQREFTEGCRVAFRDRIESFDSFHNKSPRSRSFY